MVQAYLETEENGEIRVHVLRKKTFTIGRMSDRDLRFDYNGVSRSHAVIEFAHGHFVLRDQGSTCGTFVNEKQILEHTLCEGDRVRVGPSSLMEFLFHEGAVPQERPTEPIYRPVSALHQVNLLLDGLRAMGAGRVLDEVLAIVIDSAIHLAGAQRGAVMLPDEEGKLVTRLARLDGGITMGLEGLRLSKSIPELAFQSGEVQIEADLHRPAVKAQHIRTIEFNIRAAIAVPLKQGPPPGLPGDDSVPTIGVLYVDSSDKVGFLSGATRAALEALADEAALAIRNAQLLKDSMEKLRLEQDIRAAAAVQSRLFPPRLHAVGCVEAAGNTRPCLVAGGDFFDYFTLEGGSFVFAEADVSGKGLPAAILAAQTQGMFSAGAQSMAGPGPLMDQMNRTLARRLAGTDRQAFVTMACATLEASGRLVTCNAGHNPPLVVRNDGRIEALDEGGPVLGAFEGFPYGERSTVLAPGEFVLIYSDGVNEAADVAGELFGHERLRECLGGCEGFSCSTVLERVFRALSEFTGRADQSDDITVVVVRYMGPCAPSAAA